MNVKSIFGVLSLVCFTGCLESGGSSSPSLAASPAPTPSQQTVMDAAGCTVAQNANGVTFTCNGTSASLSNGSNGTNGVNGSNGATGLMTTFDNNGVAYSDLRLATLNADGYIFKVSTSSSFVAYKPNGKIYNYTKEYFSLSNCGGSKYVVQNNSTMPISIIFQNMEVSLNNSTMSAARGCRKIKDGGAAIALVAASYFDADTNTCVNSSGWQSLYLVEDCTLPASIPDTLVTPLSFQ